MLEEAGGNARGGLLGRVGQFTEPFGGLDTALDLTHAGQVLVELLLVAVAQVAL